MHTVVSKACRRSADFLGADACMHSQVPVSVCLVLLLRIVGRTKVYLAAINFLNCLITNFPHHTQYKMLFLRAPYGEEKLFALVASPAGGSWTCYRRMACEEVQLHKTAPAFPQEAQATRHAASESAARKSNDNGVAAPALGKHHQHTVSGAQKKQAALSKSHTLNDHSRTRTPHAPPTSFNKVSLQDTLRT